MWHLTHVEAYAAPGLDVQSRGVVAAGDRERPVPGEAVDGARRRLPLVQYAAAHDPGFRCHALAAQRHRLRRRIDVARAEQAASILLLASLHEQSKKAGRHWVFRILNPILRHAQSSFCRTPIHQARRRATSMETGQLSRRKAGMPYNVACKIRRCPIRLFTQIEK